MANHLRQTKRRSKKFGLPPGALVLIGEVKTPETRITIIDYDKERFRECVIDGIDALQAYQRSGTTLWVNVYGLHDPRMMAAVGERFGLHPLVLEDILNTDQRPKVDDYGDYLYLVAHVFEYGRKGSSGKALSSDQVSIVLGSDYVLTFQERTTGTFQPLRQRLAAERSPVRAQGADYLAYCLIDSIVDREFLLIEEMSDDAEALEELVLKEVPRTRTLHEIHRLKRDVIALRRAVWPLREMLHVLQRSASGLFGSATQPYLRDVYDHTVHVVESLEALRDLLTGTVDVYLSTVSNRVNREVRTLTVIATTFMPASVVAGIFGMNFKAMPWIDLAQGFWLALTVMGGIASVMLAAFLVRKWR